MSMKPQALRSGRVRLRLAVALIAAALFAIVPAVQAYCSIDLPVGPPAAWVAADDGDAEHPAGCCDAFPDAAVDDRASPYDGAPLAGKLSVFSFPLSRGTTGAGFAASLRRTWYDLPPPEPAFRRSPRRLL